MDRNVVIATVLIGLIMFVWLYLLSPPPPPPPVNDQATVDTLELVAPPPEPEAIPLTTPPQAVLPAVGDSTMIAAQTGEEQFITVDTDLYQARFSTKGGTLVSFELKQYKKFDQQTPVQLVDTTASGALGLVFTTPASHVVDTRTLFFEPDFTGDRLQVTSEGTTLSFLARLGQGTIRQTYTFSPGAYEVGLSIVQVNASSFATSEGYEMVWNGALPFSESPQALKEEITRVAVYARSGGEVEGITGSELDEDEDNRKTLRGDVSWIASKNKYFAAVIIPPADMPREAELAGVRDGEIDDPDVQVSFRASLLMPAPTGEADVFRLYLGPLDYNQISSYDLGLYDMVDYGWDAFEWMTRPLATFIFIPAFSLLSSFIANYGLVIIVFSFLIKLVLFPLTKSSYKSMARMRELQPQMQEIKEKYADNQKKQQEATMKLYKSSGVNPLGSCLPMLLQYPIIITLWQFLQQSIEIRQQGFVWANDLSAPDAILNLPFEIPFYGDFVAGFTVLMALSMIIQMRLQPTAASGTQAMIFMYVMPVFMLVIFNGFPSGLSLYYLCYNVITAAQQKLINNSIATEKDAADTGKGGKWSAKTSKAAKLPKGGKAHKGSNTKKGGSPKKGGKKGGKKVRTR